MDTTKNASLGGWIQLRMRPYPYVGLGGWIRPNWSLERALGEEGGGGDFTVKHPPYIYIDELGIFDTHLRAYTHCFSFTTTCISTLHDTSLTPAFQQSLSNILQTKSIIGEKIAFSS